MSELSHDTADDAFHEIQLSGKQLVFLFMATTVVSVVIFLCGVLVGRGVRADVPGAAEGSEGVTAPLTPSAAASAPSAGSAPAPAASQPVPSTEGVLSYHDRLQSEKPPSERLKADSAARGADAPKTDAALSRPEAAAPPAPEPPAEPIKTDAARTQPAPAPPSDQAPAARELRPVPTSASVATARAGTWAVQVVSLRDRGAAARIADRLKDKGYPAFLVSPTSGAPAMFKVQVGRYNDRREAEQISARLKKEERFDTWIVR